MLPIVSREDGTNKKTEIDEVSANCQVRVEVEELMKASDPNKTKHLATVALQ